MTKKPTVTTISSGYYSTTALNNNFENIRDQFDNTLSLDGSTPNAMQADLDFNNNNAINVDSLEAQTLTVGGSAVSLADIQALTGIGADIQTLADIEDGTDATDAIQTVAGISLDVTSAASNSTDISTVAGIDSDVTTVAGISSDVTTVATNVSDITNFSDVYLGPAASDPVTRNDGSALQVGDLYFNTTSDEVRVYEGASWLVAYANLSDALLVSNNLSDVDSASISRSNLGLGTAATQDANTFLQVSNNLSDVNDAAASRENLGLGTTTARNAIINGNFDHWQRGTSFTAAEYGADRWLNDRVGTAGTQSRQAFTLGQTDVPNEPEYFCRTVVSSVAGASNFSILSQRLEGVRTFAGQTATLSFYAKADAAKDIAVEFAQIFGSGGSPSSSVTGIGVTTLSLTTSWQKFTVTVDVPSISGKTLGTNNNDFLRLNFWFDAGSDFNARTNSLGQQSGTFDIAQVQLEAGSVATPFERRPVGTELALCQRYYNTFLYGARFEATTAGADDKRRLPYPTPMRTTPTLSRSDTSAIDVASVTATALGTSFDITISPSASGGTLLESTLFLDAEL